MSNSILDDQAAPEAQVAAAPRRQKQPFKEATVRPPTLVEAMAMAASDDDLFADLANDYAPLREVYLDMDGLRQVKGTNGLKAISSFTGCGGSFTGFALAGWDELLAIEFVKAARDTLAINYDMDIIEPETVESFVRNWHKEYLDARPESDIIPRLQVFYNKATRSKGHVIPATVNWEKTLLEASKMEDSAVAAAAEQLRYDATFALVKGQIGQGRTLIWGDDIRGIDPQAILDALGMKPGELDCYEGSPPCKSFSTSGLREEGWGKVVHYSDERHQSTDGLFVEYLRILSVLRPKSFIAENVAGLEMGSASTDVLEPLLKAFAALGYTVQSRRINASDHGVAQVRPRVFIQGISTDLLDPNTGLPIQPSWPARESRVYTVQDALDAAGESSIEEFTHSWLGTRGDFLKAVSEREVDNTLESIPKTSWWYERLAIAKEKGEVLTDDTMRYGIGKIWHQLGLGASPENKTYQMIRCHPNLPSPTITATAAFNVPAAGPTHPHQPRKFTIAEYTWLFSFPRDYRFTGTMEQQGERMGRSVAPYMMRAIALELAATIKRAVTAEEFEAA